MIQLDVAKAGAQLFSLSNVFNARVHDGFTPVKVQWINSTDGNKPLDVKGMRSFLKGQIGQGTINGDQVELEPKTGLVSWADDGSGSQPNGVTLIQLPPQVFTRDGIFYGYIGLTDTNGTVITSINIWFNVDQNIMTAGANVPYYLDEIQAALSAVQESTDTLQRAKQEIDSQIDLSNITFEPETFENEAALKAKYPNGKSGLMVTADTGHKFIWANGTWTDAGIYQAAGVTTYKFNKIISGADDLVAPYDDLDTLPANSTVSYATSCNVKNKPTDINDNFTVHTFSNSTSNDDTYAGNGKMQALMAGGTLYWRMSWGPTYYEWQKINKRSRIITTKDQLAAPYDDLNTLPINTVVTYAVSDGVQNKPYTSADFFTVFTFGNSMIGATQLLASQNGSLYWRASWNQGTKAYYGWQNLSQTADNRIINNDDQLISPYTDLDTLPVDCLVVYATPGTKNIKHLPDGLSNYSFTIETKGYRKGNITGAIQELITLDGDMYYRVAWGYPAAYNSWHKVQQYTGQTNTLDYRAPSLSLFNNFAVIGDSYSAGSMQFSDGTWVDSQNNQWGLMLARKYGTNYTSLAKGGASAGTFLWDTLPKLKASDPQDIYYLILGINDSMDTTKTTGQKLGAPDDMHDDSSTNPRTFYGNYAKIIDAVKAKAPNAKIIMFTIMAHTEFRQEYDEAIKTIADHYKLVVADVNQDPLFDSDYYINHMKGGHPTAPLYAAQAEALERVIQKTIVDNPEYFSDSAVLK